MRRLNFIIDENSNIVNLRKPIRGRAKIYQRVDILSYYPTSFIAYSVRQLSPSEIEMYREMTNRKEGLTNTLPA